MKTNFSKHEMKNISVPNLYIMKNISLELIFFMLILSLSIVMETIRAILAKNVEALKSIYDEKPTPEHVSARLLFESYSNEKMEELIFLEIVEIARNAIEKRIGEFTLIDVTYGTLIGKHYGDEITSTEQEQYDEKRREVDDEFKLMHNKDDDEFKHIDEEFNDFEICCIMIVYNYMKEHNLHQFRDFHLYVNSRTNGGVFLYKLFMLFDHNYLCKSTYTYLYRSWYGNSYIYSKISSNGHNSVYAFDYVASVCRCRHELPNAKISSPECVLKTTSIRNKVIDRLLEKHVVREQMFHEIEKKLEIEMLYHKLSELCEHEKIMSDEIEHKHHELHELDELIQNKRKELNDLEIQLMSTNSELDASSRQLKTLRLVNSLADDITLDNKNELSELTDIKYYYSLNPKEIELWKECYIHFDEIAQALENEKLEFEEYKDNELKLLKQQDDEQTVKFNKMQQDFDADCEKYEIESTKWKSQQESKYAKYEKQINEYDSLKLEIRKLNDENANLKRTNTKAIKERDELEIALKTLNRYFK